MHLRFHTYQQTQRAYGMIAKQLTDGQPSKCIVLWGNGSFGPTFHGHASAPNKKLREKLAHHGVNIVLSNEYNTSKFTACCHYESCYSKQVQWPSQKTLIKQPELANSLSKHKLHGLLYCKHRLSSLLRSTNPYHASTKALPRYNGSISENNIGSSSRTSSFSSIKHVMASRPWNRDICSAINIMSVAYGQAFNCLPACLQRAKK